MVFGPARQARARRDIRRCLANQERIAQLLDETEAHALAAPEVSAWTVGQQLEHITQVDGAVLDGIDRLLDGDGVPGRPKLPGRLLLLTRHIPRGRAKAPEAMLPRGAETEQMKERAAATRRRLDEHLGRVRELARVRLTRPHPILGRFTPRHWFRFLDIHDRHHLAIIEDILSATRR